MVIPLLKQQDYPGDLNLTKVLIASPALQERDSACPAECSFWAWAPPVCTSSLITGNWTEWSLLTSHLDTPAMPFPLAPWLYGKPGKNTHTFYSKQTNSLLGSKMACTQSVNTWQCASGTPSIISFIQQFREIQNFNIKMGTDQGMAAFNFTVLFWGEKDANI